MSTTAGEWESYRQKLLALRARLRGDVSGLVEAALSSSDAEGSRMPIHMAERGTDAAAKESALRLSENEQRTLEAIEAALERITAGTYGVCAATGKPIPKARLDAIPYALYCVEYAEQLEGRNSPMLNRRAE